MLESEVTSGGRVYYGGRWCAAGGKVLEGPALYYRGIGRGWIYCRALSSFGRGPWQGGEVSSTTTTGHGLRTGQGTQQSQQSQGASQWGGPVRDAII